MTTVNYCAFAVLGAGSRIEFSGNTGKGAICTGTTPSTYGLYMTNGSVAVGRDISLTGFNQNLRLKWGCRATLPSSDFSNASLNCVTLSGGSNLTAINCTFNTNGVAVSASQGSTCALYLSSSNYGAFNAVSGSILDCSSVTYTGAGTGFGVSTGGIINASGSTGSLSVTANTIQAAGIIFK